MYLKVRTTHPLLGAAVRVRIEHAASASLGRPWISQGFTSLNDRLPAYLAVVAVAGDTPVGCRYLDRLAAAVRLYR
jgi:hypothetical protein